MHFLVSFLAFAIFAVTGLSLLTTTATNASPTDDLGCTLCLYMVGKISTLHNESETSAQISKTLTAYCSQFPDPEKSICMLFTDVTTISGIIELLENGLQPKTICVDLQYCSSGLLSSILEVDMDCDVCKMVGMVVYRMWKEGDTVQQICQAVGKVCELLSPPYSTECETYENVNLMSHFVALLKNKYSADQACVKLKKCPEPVWL